MNLPFNYYENKYVKHYLYNLNSRFSLSNYKALSDYILNKYYNNVYR